MQSFFTLLLVGLFSLTWCVEASSRISLSISVSNTWMPYVYLNEQRELDGKDYFLLQSTLDELGYNLVRVDDVVEKSSRTQLQHGAQDVHLGASKTNDSQSTGHFSIPYRQEKVGLFYLDPSLFNGSAHDLEQSLLDKRCIGAVNSARWYGDKFQELKEKYPENILHIESQVSQLRMLQKGRVGFVVGDELSVRALASKLKIDNLMQHPHPVFVEDVHFVFNKERVDQDFMDKFNQALRVRLQRY